MRPRTDQGLRCGLHKIETIITFTALQDKVPHPHDDRLAREKDERRCTRTTIVQNGVGDQEWRHNGLLRFVDANNS